MSASETKQFDKPRSLRNPAERERRRALLTLAHVAPLTALVEDLRRWPDTFVPDFDPLDGGVEARVLFLFEKPGPKTDRANGGSGFISRDNDDPSAEATFLFMRKAGLSRAEAVLWNFVPWWNKTTELTGAERNAAPEALAKLLALLPALDAVVLVGRTAARAKPFVGRYRIIESDHPSPLVRARYPDRWEAIPTVWRKARK